MCLALAGLVGEARAFDIEVLEVTAQGKRFDISFDVVIDADTQRAREYLHDHEQWPRLSDNVSESTLLETFADGRRRIRLVFRTCILVFCKTIRQVKDVTSNSEGVLVTENVAGLSDFAAGHEIWRILVHGTRTRVRYSGTLEPAFRVPPVIGPWIVKRKLRQRLVATARRLEQLAAAATPAAAPGGPPRATP